MRKNRLLSLLCISIFANLVFSITEKDTSNLFLLLEFLTAILVFGSFSIAVVELLVWQYRKQRESRYLRNITENFPELETNAR